MYAHGDEDTKFAHADSRAVADPNGPISGLDRSRREADESAQQAVGATHAHGGGTRQRPEEPDPWRTCFERDRDRILHAPAFRRLAGKTQVFVFPDDHQRTRLTHALEVAQVATGIARACRLNVALTEAIALGHDCGHGPGGHASEDALSPMSSAGSITPRGEPTYPWPGSTSAARHSMAYATTRGPGRRRAPRKGRWSVGPTASPTSVTISKTR